MFSYIIALYFILVAYNRINLFFIRRKIGQQRNLTIMRGAEPFFKQGKKKVGVLLIHGLTATPRELLELGNYLHLKGYTVYAPLLTGHGTSPANLFAVKHQTWLRDVDKAIKVLRDNCDEIYLLGNSFGGNLALLVGQKHRKVKGIITLAAPFIFPYENLKKVVLTFMRQIKLVQKKTYEKKVERIYRKTKRLAYDEIPFVAVVEMMRVIKKSRKILGEINKQVLLMQSSTDEVLTKENLEYAYDRLASKSKKKVWIPKSIHVFISDKNKLTAFKEIYEFIVGK